MKKLACSLFVIALLAVPAAAGAKSGASALLGTWKALEMRRGNKRQPTPKGIDIFIHFKKKGVFVTEVKAGQKTKSKKGTWKVRGGKLITKVGSETDTIKYEIKGKKLTLTKLGESPKESIVFKKQ